MNDKRKLRSSGMRRSRRAAILWTAMGLPFVIAMIWVGKELWRESINLSLMEAIDQDDTKSAIRLLNAGADAKLKDGRRVSADLLERLYVLRDWLLGRKVPPAEEVIPEPVFIKAYRAEDASAVGRLDSSPLLGALLDHGADPSLLSSNGVTVLHWTVMSDQVQLTKYLLDRHVRPDLKDIDGETPLMFASDRCAKLLLDHGADANVRDGSGNTPLMSGDDPRTEAPAVAHVKLLLAHHADIDAQNNKGQTALVRVLDHDLVWNKEDLAVAECLIAHGANVQLKDRHGKTALDYLNASSKDLIANEKDIIRLRAHLRSAAKRRRS